MNRFFVLLAAASLSTAALADEPTKEASAAGKSGNPPLMLSFADLKWTELPERKGMQFAVLSGDPRRGAYTQMRKVPAGTDNPLHTHGSELKNVIISGVWYTGADAASARDFGPGSIVTMPADWVHVSGCRAGDDCVFYQEGKGKFDFNPVARR
jgi:quercetin dioxygenase-like cupin family protein